MINQYSIPIFEFTDSTLDMDLIERETEKLLAKGCELLLFKAWGVDRLGNPSLKTILCRKANSEDNYKFMHGKDKVRVAYEQISRLYPSFQKLLNGDINILWYKENDTKTNGRLK